MSTFKLNKTLNASLPKLRKGRLLGLLFFLFTQISFAQPGNDKPRQFYHPDGTALNRLGFNSLGMEAVYLNINHYLDFTVPFGISIGKNKWVESKDAPAAHAVVAERFRTVAYW